MCTIKGEVGSSPYLTHFYDSCSTLLKSEEKELRQNLREERRIGLRDSNISIDTWCVSHPRPCGALDESPTTQQSICVTFASLSSLFISFVILCVSNSPLCQRSSSLAGIKRTEEKLRVIHDTSLSLTSTHRTLS